MQAARGTAIAPGEQPLRPTSRARARTVMALVALTAYAVDITTKVLAVERLDGQPDKPLVGDLLVLHLTRNPGAAFSTGTEYTVVLSCLAIVAVLVVLFLARRVRSVLWAVGLGLLLAGVSGNLTDRILRDPGPLRGHVIDFLMLPNWPVFNVADICINLAAALILVQAFRGIRLDGTRVPHDEDDQPGDERPEDERPEDAAATAEPRERDA